MESIYLQRCDQLALLAKGNTKTNPLVGAVIVYHDKIIGEGYHTAFGAAHAEIEAFNSVKTDDLHKLSSSTLYVNLEPCCIHGKTPPCVEEIIRRGIKKVVIGMLDPNPKINGKGIEILRNQGVEIIIGNKNEETLALNKAFIKNMSTQMPYIILKFACSADGFIGKSDHRVKISNAWSEYIVHKIRHEVDAILIGTNTAIVDNPSLTNRLYYGNNPIRIILDRQKNIPVNYKLFTDHIQTWLFTNSTDHIYPESVKVFPWEGDQKQMMEKLLIKGIGSILVEGGAKTLQSFIDLNLWDEIWCTRSSVSLQEGIKAPNFTGKMVWYTRIGTDELNVFLNC